MMEHTTNIKMSNTNTEAHKKARKQVDVADGGEHKKCFGWFEWC